MCRRGGECRFHDGGLPGVSAWALWYLRLYQRCRDYGALPDPGGLLDQDEVTMGLLDVIGAEVRAWEIEQGEARQREQERRIIEAMGGHVTGFGPGLGG